MIALLSGVLLTMSNVVVASNTIQVSSFPTRVLFHNNNMIKEIDGAGENGVINYRNKAYIPIRAFSEAMGASVTYKAGTSETGNLNNIDIYSSSSTTENDLTLQDTDGYVSIGHLNIIKGVNGHNVLSSGIIQVNKDLTGKAIDIEILNKGGELARDSYVSVLNEDIDMPKVGDIRPFKTDLVYDEEEVGSYRISVHDIFKIEHIGISKQNGDPIAIMFGPPEDFRGKWPIGKIIPFTIGVYNTDTNDLSINSMDLEFDVYKANSQNQLGNLVYSYKLPSISGPMASNSGFTVKIPWNQRGLDGNFISSGYYIFEIKAPSTLNYSLKDSNVIKKYNVYLRSSDFGVSLTPITLDLSSKQAVLFPSKVLIHTNDEVKEITGLGEEGVLNYKNKTYIPLRAFAEAMGATVTYAAPSSTTGNLSKIDILSPSKNN